MKYRKRLILGSITILSAFPFVAASTSNEASTNNNGDGNENGESGQVDPAFPTYKAIVDSILKERLSSLIDTKIIEFRKKAIDILRKKGKEDTQELIKGIYYQKVADFLSRNREDILENPKEFGFQITFPYVLAENKEIYVSNVTYNGTDYDNVKFGTTANTSYFEDTIARKSDFTTNVNTTNPDGLKTKTGEYFDNLANEFEDIFANEQDIPRLKVETKQLESNKDTTDLLFDDFYNGVELTLPSGYESWDDYVKQKAESRFLNYDLQENSNDDQEDQENPAPPILPNVDAAITDPLNNLEAMTENVPSLTPYVAYEYYEAFTESNYDTIVDTGNKKPTSLLEYFNFDNPIFTRYDYSVISLVKDSETGKLKATVAIRDRNNLSLSRSYETYIEKLSSKEYTVAKETASRIIQETYFKFYDALGLGDKINFKNLANQSLVVASYNMIVAAYKLITQKREYTIKYENILRKYKDQVDSNLKLTSPNFKKDLLNLFLGSLNRSDLIDESTNVTYGYFEYLQKAYSKLFNDYKTSIKEENNKNYIIKNFNNFGYDIKVFEKGIKTVSSDLSYWFGLINADTFDIENKFNKNNAAIKQIQSTLSELGILSSPEIINKDENTSAKVKRFKKAYEKMQTSTPIAHVQKKRTLYYVLSSFFGLITLITFLTGAILRFSKNKNLRLSKKNSFIVLGVSIFMLIITITMIVLSIGGL